MRIRFRFCMALFAPMLVCGTVQQAGAQQNALQPALSIDQSELDKGSYPLWHVLQSGQQIFNVPFTPAGADAKGDGLGEGPNGPRAFQRRAFWPYPWPNVGTTAARQNRGENYIYDFPFIKLNGLGATSCFDCHNSIGEYVQPGSKPINGVFPKIRKPFTPGGAAGFSTNAFINAEFPARQVALIRNPPHIFGTGYTNALGEEMSVFLQLQARAVDMAAKKYPGKRQSIKLKTHGVSFGVYAATWFPKAKKLVKDTSGVEGVASDLIVRPFQWKGISSSVRHFARDALDFHFSMQAVEKVGHTDCDLDGKKNEINLGDVAALTAYVTMTRPPQQQIPKGLEAVVARGEQVFTGGFKGAAGEMCATCHIPNLTLHRPRLTIMTPPVPDITSLDDCPQEAASLINPIDDSAQLPVHRRVAFMWKHIIQAPGVVKAKAAEKITPQSLYQAIDTVVNTFSLESLAELGYQIDLNLKASPDVPSYVFPRLPAKQDGSISVPLFSDLRTHNMGEALADPVAQGADVAGIEIAPPLFLTRALWGVGDTGPWLHDGRARTLEEAILLHQSSGSEANDVIAAFKKLSADDKQALMEFLLSLRLPLDEGTKSVAYQP